MLVRPEINLPFKRIPRVKQENIGRGWKMLDNHSWVFLGAANDNSMAWSVCPKKHSQPTLDVNSNPRAEDIKRHRMKRNIMQ
jgi:hypothetical protein